MPADSPVVADSRAAPQTVPVPVENLGTMPARVDIPKLGAGAWIVPLGLEDDGALAAPTDPDTVGWFQDGPGVGGQGNMLLDGHVDWAGRLRAFGLLKTLQPGDQIDVTDVNGGVRSYTVVWTQMVDANNAPLEDIFPTTPDEQLTLITCGGAFDQRIHMYLSRWVVRALPVVSALNAN